MLTFQPRDNISECDTVALINVCHLYNVVFICCMIAVEQSSLEASKYYGRFNGDIHYEEKKLNQKLKVGMMTVVSPHLTFVTDV